MQVYLRCQGRRIPYTIVTETQPNPALRTPSGRTPLVPRIAPKQAEKTGDKSAATAAANIGIGLQSFLRGLGSVAENRKVGLGHGNLGQDAAIRGDRVLLASALAMSPLPPQGALSRSR